MVTCLLAVSLKITFISYIFPTCYRCFRGSQFLCWLLIVKYNSSKWSVYFAIWRQKSSQRTCFRLSRHIYMLLGFMVRKNFRALSHSQVLLLLFWKCKEKKDKQYSWIYIMTRCSGREKVVWQILQPKFPCFDCNVSRLIFNTFLNLA